MGIKKLAKRAWSSATNNPVKAAINIAAAPISASSAIGNAAVGAAKGILSGDINTAYDTLKSGAKGAVNTGTGMALGGVKADVFKTASEGSVDQAMPAEKSAETIAAEEQDAIGKQYKESILNRAKGRYNNSLLGGGYF